MERIGETFIYAIVKYLHVSEERIDKLFDIIEDFFDNLSVTKSSTLMKKSNLSIDSTTLKSISSDASLRKLWLMFYPAILNNDAHLLYSSSLYRLRPGEVFIPTIEHQYLYHYSRYHDHIGDEKQHDSYQNAAHHYFQ